jgi:hypothetical protein
MNTPRVGAAAAVLPDGRVLIAGGEGEDDVPLSSAEIYDPAANFFFDVGVPHMNVARFLPAAAPMSGGRVLVAGGQTPAATATASAEVYMTPPSLSGQGIDFGDATTGSSAGVRSARIVNRGAQVLRASAIGISGPGAGDYAITDDGCRGRALEFGEDCEIAVRFTPSATGSRDAQLDVASNAADAPAALQLGGTGVAPNSGPQGPQGPQGPAGQDGRDATVTCKVKRKGRAKKRIKVKCTVVFSSAKARARLPFTLSRRGEVVRRGSIRIHHGHGRLRPADTAGLDRGSYLLRVGGRDGAEARFSIG